VEIGVFLPIGNNGWLISHTSPQYLPTFELNKTAVQKAESYGFDFALTMIKLHGFGGRTRHWDYNLESFTLMAGLAAVTKTIKIYATTPALAIPPAIAARMAVTIDEISGGRFGINVVSGWQKAEYDQMGLWPETHFERRYQYLAEYTTVMKDLWTTGVCNLDGEFFKMKDCRCLPLPQAPIKVICAGQSPAGMEFVAKYADFGFCLSSGINDPLKSASTISRLIEACAKTGRTVRAYVQLMIIADETDDAASAKWDRYRSGADRDAIAWMTQQARADTRASSVSSVMHQTQDESAFNLNMGTLIGSYRAVAEMLDELSTIEGLAGILLTLDDYVDGLDNFGTKIQPLMKSRSKATGAAILETFTR
jgi:pyrimidine oxygenase